jgi:hypothetical protein
VIFTAPTADSRLVSLSQSPNGQYIAVGLTSGTATSTAIVDRLSGATVRTLAGSSVVWT